MDTVICINKLRAQFLFDCPEKEQMKRIIKPYIPQPENDISSKDNGTCLDEKVEMLFTTPGGHNILPELESPPISENYMEDYVSSGRLMAKDKHLARSRGPLGGQARDNEKVDKVEDRLSPEVDKNDPSPKDSRTIDAHSISSAPLSVQSTTDYTSTKDSGASQLSMKDAELEDPKKKNGRKLPFSRIFKGKRDSSDSHHKTPMKAKSDHRKKSSFDMKFDYDDDIEEDDDEDEDEDEEGENLQSQFFQIDSGSSKSSQANGVAEGENYVNRKSSSGSLGFHGASSHANGTSVTVANARKSHFPQNMIPRTSLLDGGKNGSLRSDRLVKTNGPEDPVSINGKKDTADVDDYSSDLDSYINEQDLDKLNLDGDLPTNDGDISSQRKSDILDSADGTEDTRMVLSHNTASDSGSSYGRSLLDSDFDGDDFRKHNSLAIESTSLLDDSDIQPDTVSHSIPMTLDEYGIYHGQDDSTLNNVFDKAVMDIKSTKPQLRERRSSGHLIPHSISSRRYSTSSNLGGRIKGHMRSSSTTSNESSRLKGDLTKKHGTGNDARQSKLTLPGICRSGSGHKISSIHIQKVTDFSKPETGESLLSSLFNRKKHSSNDDLDVLEYFSFVSGNKVPKNEATTLRVYIQASRTYHQEPFEANVRNSATIFEAIGFILYLFSTKFKPDNLDEDGLTQGEIQDPNNFCLKIVDEDGQPFEDDFGKLGRKKTIQTLSDNEVVLCKVGSAEQKRNEEETPLPFDTSGEIIGNNHQNTALNQFSYYKPILGNDTDKEGVDSSKVVEAKVFLHPCNNRKFNYTTVKVLVTSSLNDILVRYCKMKGIDPNEYVLKAPEKMIALNLNDTVMGLDGQYEVEVVSKKDARELKLEKSRPDIGKPKLPTIQSTGLTPLTLEPTSAYLGPQNAEKAAAVPITKESRPTIKTKRLGSKNKLILTTQNSGASNISGSTSNGFFKTKNSSKTSLHGSYYTPDHLTPNGGGISAGGGSTNYQDLFSGAYHKYKVWRRQQMSLMNKHERALALDGDYIYIVPPEKHLHWHENVKTKSIHISQVILVRKSKRVPEYFKLFIQRGQHDIKRYYFEAVSPEECTEIVSRIQNSLVAYKMNHK